MTRCIPPPSSLFRPFTFLARVLNLARKIPESDVTVATFCWTAYSTLIGVKGLPFYYVQHYEPLFFLHNPLLYTLAKTTYLFPNNLIANSRWTQNILKRNFSKDSFLVQPGVDTKTFYPINAKGKKGKKVLWIGTGASRKGFYDAYEAMKIISKRRGDVEFIVNYLPPSLSTQDIPVRNVGFIPDKKLANLYSSCDVFLFTSWFEGFGLPPLEAMACGLPVVTTACGGIDDFAKDEVNSLVVPPRNPKAAAKAVLRLLSEEGLAERIRKKGLRTAKNFTWSKAVDKVEKIFMKCA